MSFVLGVWSALSLKIKLAVYAALILGLVLIGMWMRGIWEDAKRTDDLRHALNDLAEQQDRSHTIGMNLETGLNDYAKPARELDRKVQDATSHDSGNRFSVGSVQRTTARIAAGEAARKRAQ